MQKTKKYIAIFILFLLFWNYQNNSAKAASAVTIDKQNFPDVAIRKTEKKYDVNRDGKLSVREIKEIKQIKLHVKGAVTSFKGLQYFTNLRALYYYGGGIFDGKSVEQAGKTETLKLSGCKKLRILYLRGNIKKISIKHPKSVKKLQIYNNACTTLNLSAYTQAETIYVQSNSITKLKLPENSSVRDLRLGLFTMKKLHLKEMDKLWRVEIRGNNTLKVSMEGLDKLERALVNDIAGLRVKNCVRLCKLRIYDMQKGDIVLNDCTNIDAVEVRGSTLKRLNLQNLKRLVYLDIGTSTKIQMLYLKGTVYEKEYYDKKINEQTKGLYTTVRFPYVVKEQKLFAIMKLKAKNIGKIEWN